MWIDFVLDGIGTRVSPVASFLRQRWSDVARSPEQRHFHFTLLFNLPSYIITVLFRGRLGQQGHAPLLIIERCSVLRFESLA